MNFDLNNIASFKIDDENFLSLEQLSNEYNLDFGKSLAYYSVYSNFYNDYQIPIDKMKLEEEFIKQYSSIKRKYNKGSIKNYVSIISSIIYDIECFPIPRYNQELLNSYIYKDTWTDNFEVLGIKHRGTDIISINNKSGEIPIVSMTDGTIEDIGWDVNGGYNIGIRSNNGNYYYYAHMDSFDANLKKGQKVEAGQLLGYMGNTGNLEESVKNRFQVHLHIGIKTKKPDSKGEFWINPYPFLKHIENYESY